jgi:ZIP family zinc transporter
MATLIGFLLVGLGKERSARFNGWALISAAIAMIAASVVEIIPSALAIDLGWQDSLIWLALGGGSVYVIKLLVKQVENRRPSMAGSVLVVTLALTLHNIPEGTASIAATGANLEAGLATGAAIAFQNIPEGLSIAALAMAASQSKFRVFLLVAVSVVAEILGAAIIWVNQDYLNATISSHLLLAVAGMMLAISFIELLPQGRKLLVSAKR